MDKRIQLKRSKNILESRDAALAKIAELSGVTIDGEPVAFQYLDNGNVETILAIKAQKNEDRGVMVLFDSANKDLWNAIDEKLSADDLKTVNGTSLVGSGNVDANDVVYIKNTSGTYHEVLWIGNRWAFLHELEIRDGKLYLDVDSHVLYWATDQLHEIFDLSDFYNKEEVNNLLDDKLDVSAYTPVDLTNYYDKDETNGLLDDKVDKDTFNRFSGDTVRDLYSLHQDKLDVSAYTPVDLSNYYDKDETNGLLDNKLDVSAYTQIEEVVFGTLLDDGFHTGEWVESHGNEEFIPDRETVEPSDSNIYVDVVENKVYRWRRQYYEISGSGGDMSEYVQKTTFNILSGNVDDNKAELDAAEVAVFGVDTDASLVDASAFYSASTLLSGSTSMVDADMTLASSISVITGELDEKVDATDLKTVNGESIVGSGNIDTDDVVLGKLVLVTGSGMLQREDFYKFLGTYSMEPGEMIRTPNFSDTAETPDTNKTYVDILTKKAYWYDANPSLMSDRFKELSVADLSNYYNKTEIDSIVSGKSDSSDVYTKEEIDETLDGVVKYYNFENDRGSYNNEHEPGIYSTIDYVSGEGDLNGDRVANADDLVLIIRSVLDHNAYSGYGYYSGATDDTYHEYTSYDDFKNRLIEIVGDCGDPSGDVDVNYVTRYTNFLKYNGAQTFRVKKVRNNGDIKWEDEFINYKLIGEKGIVVSDVSGLTGVYVKTISTNLIGGEGIAVNGNIISSNFVGGEGIDIEEGVITGGLRYIAPGAILEDTKDGQYLTLGDVSTEGDLNNDGIADIRDFLVVLDAIMNDAGTLSSSNYDFYSEMEYYKDSGTTYDSSGTTPSDIYEHWCVKTSGDTELSKRVANFLGYFNEHVVDEIYDNPVGHYFGTPETNYWINVIAITNYTDLLTKYSEGKQVSIIKIRHVNGKIKTNIVKSLTIDSYSYSPYTETHNVDFNTIKTATGYGIRANVEVFDCGEFDGPQVNSGD